MSGRIEADPMNSIVFICPRIGEGNSDEDAALPGDMRAGCVESVLRFPHVFQRMMEHDEVIYTWGVTHFAFDDANPVGILDVGLNEGVNSCEVRKARVTQRHEQEPGAGSNVEDTRREPRRKQFWPPHPPSEAADLRGAPT